MSKKYTRKDFVNAARAKGYVAKAAMGFSVPFNQAAAAPQVGSSTLGAPTGQGATTQGGVLGFLTPQNGYQAQLAPTTQYNYGAPMQTALNQNTAGYNAGMGNIGAEQGLAGQYQGLASGTGPSLAQNVLAQGTGANVANQAALMAGNRGASANAGLIGRQAGQQGAAIQNAATSQAANLGMQQQLGALGAQANLYGNIGQQAQGIQSGANTLYGTTVAGNNTQNANTIANYQQMQNINSQIAQQNTNAVGKTASGLESMASSAAGPIGSMIGGGGAPGGGGSGGGGGQAMASMMAKGGEIGGPTSHAGRFLARYDGGGQVAQVNTPTLQGPPADPPSSGGSSGGSSGASSMMSMAPLLLAALNKGGPAPVVGEQLAAKGKMVPGKPKVQGDNLKNDVVPAMLSPGEIVIPRSIAQHPDAPSRAAAFVQAIQAKHRANRK